TRTTRTPAPRCWSERPARSTAAPGASRLEVRQDPQHPAVVVGRLGISPVLLAPALRAPRTTVAVTLAALTLLAAPALGMNLRSSTEQDLPRDIPVMRGYDRLVAAFPTTGGPHRVVVRAPAGQAGAVRAPWPTWPPAPAPDRSSHWMVSRRGFLGPDSIHYPHTVPGPDRVPGGAAVAVTAAYRPGAGHGGCRPRRGVRGGRDHGRERRLHRPAGGAAALGDRIRGVADGRDDGVGVPLHRGGAGRRSTHRAVGGGGVRAADPGVPEHMGGGTAGLRAHRPH